MRFFLAALALIAGTALAQPAAAQDGAQSSACAAKPMSAHWEKATAAFKAKDSKTAATETDAIIAACGTGDGARFARVMRAEIALNAGDAKMAAALLEPVPRPAPKPVGSFSSWLAMHAQAMLKDDAAFLAERDALMASVDKALTDPATLKGKKLETFKVGDITLTAYQVALTQGVMKRSFYVSIVPPGVAFPRSLMITTDPSFDPAIEMGTMYFADTYLCGAHATIQLIPVLSGATREQPPRYPQVKALAQKYVTEQMAEIKARPTGFSDCKFTHDITPGLD